MVVRPERGGDGLAVAAGDGGCSGVVGSGVLGCGGELDSLAAELPSDAVGDGGAFNACVHASQCSPFSRKAYEGLGGSTRDSEHRTQTAHAACQRSAAPPPGAAAVSPNVLAWWHTMHSAGSAASRSARTLPWHAEHRSTWSTSSKAQDEADVTEALQVLHLRQSGWKKRLCRGSIRVLPRLSIVTLHVGHWPSTTGLQSTQNNLPRCKEKVDGDKRE